MSKSFLSQYRGQVIEYYAYWRGAVNTTNLSSFLQLSRQQSHKILSEYLQQFPANLYYNRSEKHFVPTNGFVPRFINEDVNQFLDWYCDADKSGDVVCEQKNNDTSFAHTKLALPKRNVSALVMRAIFVAIKQKLRLDVEYISLSNPNPEGRIIQPHTIVKTGTRWHLRAYDEKNAEFRDFVLSRFRAEPDLIGPATHTKKQDKNWNTLLDVIFEPDPRLSPQQKSVIEQDYQMQNSKLVVKTRAALVQYLLQEMQVNIKFLDEHPEAQQLVLVNKSDIKAWLFDT